MGAEREKIRRILEDMADLMSEYRWEDANRSKLDIQIFIDVLMHES